MKVEINKHREWERNSRYNDTSCCLDFVCFSIWSLFSYLQQQPCFIYLLVELTWEASSSQAQTATCCEDHDFHFCIVFRSTSEVTYLDLLVERINECWIGARFGARILGRPFVCLFVYLPVCLLTREKGGVFGCFLVNCGDSWTNCCYHYYLNRVSEKTGQTNSNRLR